MPTQSTTYNTRVTDEALEKRFRDTFRSQGGAELVDDLYASGVIIPVVDFTAAAEGSSLRQDLQSAWDFATGRLIQAGNGTQIATTTAGFWKVNLNMSFDVYDAGSEIGVFINDGTSITNVWGIGAPGGTGTLVENMVSNDFVVFLRSGDTLELRMSGWAASTSAKAFLVYRQLADVYGNFTQPSGFTSS